MFRLLSGLNLKLLSSITRRPCGVQPGPVHPGLRVALVAGESMGDVADGGGVGLFLPVRVILHIQAGEAAIGLGHHPRASSR